MKNIIKITTTLSFLLLVTFEATAQVDKFAKIGSRVSFASENESWIKISVPFNLLSNPRLEAANGRRPTTIESAFNPEYINDVKVKLYVCFTNEFKKKILRGSSFLDSQYYQYYSAEQTFETVKLDRNTKYANFLFPAAIAERDGFGGSYVNPTGYVIEISIEGQQLEISNSTMFEKYRDESTLLKFKQQAVTNSASNQNIMVPAHQVYPSYFLKDAYLKTDY